MKTVHYTGPMVILEVTRLPTSLQNLIDILITVKHLSNPTLALARLWGQVVELSK